MHNHESLLHAEVGGHPTSPDNVVVERHVSAAQIAHDVPGSVQNPECFGASVGDGVGYAHTG